MAEHAEPAENTAKDRSTNVVLVPVHLREQVEEHVRQLVEGENNVSGYMLSGFMNRISYQDEMNKCERKVIAWRNGNAFLKCIE